MLFILFRAPGLRQNRGPRTGSELLSTGVPLEPQYDCTGWFGGSELFDVLSMEAFEIPVRMLELFGSSFSDMCCKVVH